MNDYPPYEGEAFEGAIMIAPWAYSDEEVTEERKLWIFRWTHQENLYGGDDSYYWDPWCPLNQQGTHKGVDISGEAMLRRFITELRADSDCE